MRNTRPHQLHVLVDKAERARLERLAEDRGETISSMIRRWALDAYRARFGEPRERGGRG